MQRISLLVAGIVALATATAHAFVGQAHLARIISTSVESIDSAVMFAVWHMVTIALLTSAIGLLLLPLCRHQQSVKLFSLAIAIVYCLFGVVFIATSYLYSEPTIQWIPMLVVSILSLTGYVYTGKK